MSDSEFARLEKIAARRTSAKKEKYISRSENDFNLFYWLMKAALSKTNSNAFS